MHKQHLNRTLKIIDANPASFDMYTWIDQKNTGCGTIGCLAGFAEFAAVVDGYPLPHYPACDKQGYKIRSPRKTEENAGNYLGLSSRESNRLFYLYKWPTLFSDRYVKAEKAKDRIAALKSRIKYFIKTGT